VIYLLYGTLFLYMTYKFANLIFKNQLVGILSMLVLVWDPYFHQAISFPLLDFPMAIFFLIGLYLFIISKKWWQYSSSSLFFGLALSTKFFPSLILIITYLVIYQYLMRKKQFKIFILNLPLIPIIYTISYLEFLLRNSLLEFVKYQWWVTRWRMGNPIVFGNGLLTMFLGKFRPWWQTTEKLHSYTAEWSIFIPIISGLALISVFWFWKNKLYKLIYGLVILTIIYINLATEGGLKYLTYIYPFLVIFAVSLIMKKFKNIKS
jgi:hypothetical protein